MLKFSNGLSISGNCNVVKTKSGVLITNDLGLNIEVSDSIWNLLNLK
jgi:hypothetical protein